MTVKDKLGNILEVGDTVLHLQVPYQKSEIIITKGIITQISDNLSKLLILKPIVEYKRVNDKKVIDRVIDIKKSWIFGSNVLKYYSDNELKEAINNYQKILNNRKGLSL